MGLLSWFKRVLGITFELNADDIVVFMVGPAGGGKSWFMQEVTKCDLVKASRELRPSTTKVQAIRCELSAKAKNASWVAGYNYIVFVDTPSFLTDPDQDTEVERNTTSWLKKSRSQSTRLGTIYVDRVASIPFRESNTIQQHLDQFALTFPGREDFLSTPPLRLHGILTHNSEESRITQDRINSCKSEFQKQFDKLHPSFFHARGKLEWVASYHHECFQQDNTEEAWNAVVKLFTY